MVEILARAEARHPGLRIGLAAPTGKAARRLGEAVMAQRAPLPCSTLHRWLEAGSRGFGRHRQRPLELDLLVIDDDPDMLTLFKTSLEPWGFQILPFERVIHPK